MRHLTSGEIDRCVTSKAARRVAVENFLGTMGTNEHEARSNMWLDAKLYNWNAPTVAAIKRGIDLACK